ncbi:hypothetical protein D3C75_1301230 [compost metagenome]
MLKKISKLISKFLNSERFGIELTNRNNVPHRVEYVVVTNGVNRTNFLHKTV